MSSRRKKQAPGLYFSIDEKTGENQQKINHAMRRRNKAWARKSTLKNRLEHKDKLKNRGLLASRIYWES